jgi:hypothetical protein
MKWGFSVPSDSLKLMLSLIRKVVKNKHKGYYVPICFSSAGLHAWWEDVCIHVPVALPIKSGKFSLQYHNLDSLTKADSGDVVFNTRAGYQDDTDQDCHALCLSYKENGISKSLMIGADLKPKIDLSLFKYPASVIESETLLSDIAVCAPHLLKTRAHWALDCLCFHEDKVVATDEMCLFVAKNESVKHISFPKGCVDEDGFTSGRFLLTPEVIPLLPKSGTCRFSSWTTPVVSVGPKTKEEETKDVSLLCIVFESYCVFAKSVDQPYRDYQRILELHQEDDLILDVDYRDIEVFKRQSKSLPKDDYAKEPLVRLHFVDGRLCADSVSLYRDNVRLRFSECTTGSIDDRTCVYVSLLNTLFGVCSILRQCLEPAASQLTAKAENIIAVGATTNLDAQPKIPEPVLTVEIKESWQQPKSSESKASKPRSAKKKESCSSDEKTIAALRKENEQLKKIISQLKEGSPKKAPRSKKIK